MKNENQSRSAESGRYVKSAFAELNKATTVSESKKLMHPLTKIFDLVRLGKNKQALKLMKKLSAEDSAELDRIVRSLETKLIIAE